jgi:uncharacterized membrane protein (DUF485 family)
VRVFAALAVLLTLALAFGYCTLALTSWHKDNLAGPVMGVLGVLALVLGVGLTGVITRRPRVPDQQDPPGKLRS